MHSRREGDDQLGNASSVLIVRFSTKAHHTGAMMATLRIKYDPSNRPFPAQTCGQRTSDELTLSHLIGLCSGLMRQ